MVSKADERAVIDPVPEWRSSSTQSRQHKDGISVRQSTTRPSISAAPASLVGPTTEGSRRDARSHVQTQHDGDAAGPSDGPTIVVERIIEEEMMADQDDEDDEAVTLPLRGVALRIVDRRKEEGKGKSGRVDYKCQWENGRPASWVKRSELTKKQPKLVRDYELSRYKSNG